MTTMWTPAPQRTVLRNQEYRRWVLTSEPRKKPQTPAPHLGPVDWELASREAWAIACQARDAWVQDLELMVKGSPSTVWYESHPLVRQ
jgi:hypothetical protein